MLDEPGGFDCIEVMKRKFLALFATAATLAGFITGCTEGVDGHSHAGVPFVKNKVEGNYPRSVQQVLEAARAVIKFNGQLVGDNIVNNSLEGRVDQTTIWVRVEEVDPSKPITRVQVQTRTRAGVPDLDLAHELEKQIALQLAAR